MFQVWISNLVSSLTTGMRQRSRPSLHLGREEHQPGGGRENSGRGLRHVLQRPRAVRTDPAQQEGCSVCLQRLREQRSILRQPLVSSCSPLTHAVTHVDAPSAWQHQRCGQHKSLKWRRWSHPFRRDFHRMIRPWNRKIKEPQYICLFFGR